MVKDGELHTPKTKSCLNGITRQTIIELAEQENIKINIRNISKEEILEADEAFLCSSLAEINPITSIESRTYSSNPLTQLLQLKFQQLTQG